MREQDLAPLIEQAARRAGLDVLRSAHDAREWRLASPDEDREDTYVRLSGDGLEVEFLRSFSPFVGTAANDVSSSARADMRPRIAAAAKAIDWRMTTTWSPADATAVARRTCLSDDVSVPAFQEILSDLDDVVSACRSEASAVLQGVAGPVPETPPDDDTAAPPRRPGRAHGGPGAPSSDPGKAELVPSIIATFCCGCLPLGVVAIIFSVQATSHHAAGRYEQAATSARRARVLWITSFALSALFVLIQTFIALAQNM